MRPPLRYRLREIADLKRRGLRQPARTEGSAVRVLCVPLRLFVPCAKRPLASGISGGRAAEEGKMRPPLRYPLARSNSSLKARASGAGAWPGNAPDRLHAKAVDSV
jgi:hypothetical protein